MRQMPSLQFHFKEKYSKQYKEKCSYLYLIFKFLIAHRLIFSETGVSIIALAGRPRTHHLLALASPVLGLWAWAITFSFQLLPGFAGLLVLETGSPVAQPGLDLL